MVLLDHDFFLRRGSLDPLIGLGAVLAEGELVDAFLVLRVRVLLGNLGLLGNHGLVQQGLEAPLAEHALAYS